MVRCNAQRGLTLIELAVVLFMAALVALMAAPFGVTWANNAKVKQAQTFLQHGFSVAKSLALQNPTQAVLSQPAAVLCLSNGQLSVYPGGTCGAGLLSWQASLPSGVQVKFGSAALSCITVNNSGAPVATAACTTTNLAYSVTKGTATLSASLY